MRTKHCDEPLQASDVPQPFIAGHRMCVLANVVVRHLPRRTLKLADHGAGEVQVFIKLQREHMW